MSCQVESRPNCRSIRLAGWSSGQRLEPGNPRRVLVRRQVLSTSVPQFILGHRCSGSTFDTSDDPLAGDFVGNPENNHLGDAVQLSQHCLDLSRINPVAVHLEKRATAATEVDVTTDEIRLIASG